MSGPMPISGLPAIASEHARLREQAQDLEAVFFRQMLQAMRDAGDQSGTSQMSQGEKVFRAMFDDEVARQAVRQQESGLAEALYRQLSRHLPAEGAIAVASSVEATDVPGE